jgi:hypothetical protein
VNVLERLIKANKKDNGYRCRHRLHFGNMPKDWKLENRCKKENCPFLMTKEDYDKWKGGRKVVFYD